VNVGKGVVAKEKELLEAFKTTDLHAICLEILQKGELQVCAACVRACALLLLPPPPPCHGGHCTRAKRLTNKPPSLTHSFPPCLPGLCPGLRQGTKSGV
jgi:hypothetical protein